MNLINPGGIEVTVDALGWEQIVRRGEAHRFRRVPTKTIGTGPDNKIAILLYGNGIGDMVHSLPGICAKVQAGFDVTIMAEAELCTFFERTGAETIPVHTTPEGTAWTPDGTPHGFIVEHKETYGAFYSLRHWCVAHDEDTLGVPTMTRFEQVAHYLEVELPDTFDWRPYLIPDKSRTTLKGKYAVLSMQASSRQRGYPRPDELKSALQAKHMDYVEIGLPEWYGIKYPDARRYDIADLPYAVRSARTCIAVDSGILAIALALRIPTVALFGPTSESIIAEQFRKYNPNMKLTVMRSASDDPCRPCNFHSARGYGVEGKCTRIPKAECMTEIEPQSIVEALGAL